MRSLSRSASVCFLPTAAFAIFAVMNSDHKEPELIRMAESIKLYRATILSLGPHLPEADLALDQLLAGLEEVQEVLL
jgi:hypothetical protein